MIGRCVDLRRLAAIGSPLIAAALCTAALALAQESLTAENAWVPWAPPVLKVHVAYMTIVNRSAADRHIVAADSPDYERIELHRSTVKDGVSTMQTVEEVRVPANGRVEFAPAGLHVMLVGPKRPQVVDGRVQIVLRLRSGEQVGVSAVVRRRDAAGHGPHSHH